MYGVCVHMHMQIHRLHVFVHTLSHMWKPEAVLDVFLSHSPPYKLKLSGLKPKLTDSASLGALLSSRISCFWLLHSGISCTIPSPPICVDIIRDLNSSPHASWQITYTLSLLFFPSRGVYFFLKACWVTLVTLNDGSALIIPTFVFEQRCRIEDIIVDEHVFLKIHTLQQGQSEC